MREEESGLSRNPLVPPGFPDPKRAVEGLVEMGFFSQEEATRNLENDVYLRQNFDQVKDSWYQGKFIASLNGQFFIEETKESLDEMIKGEPNSRAAVIVSTHYLIFTNISPQTTSV